MGIGKFALTWGKFPRGTFSIVIGIVSLWFTTYVDLWSKLNWYGQLLLIVGITFLFMSPSVTMKSDKVTVEKEDNQDAYA